MELSPRLSKISSLIPKAMAVADVGTDHGYVLLSLLMEKRIEHAIAMDVNPMPLKRAEKNMLDYGYFNQCEFRLSNGLENLKANEADVIVIAGMGGLLIRDILTRGRDVITPQTRLILQPMIAAPELRIHLYENGFNIENEYVVREENKFYNIICASRGNNEYTDEDIYIGKNVMKNSPDVFNDYILYKQRVCKGIIDGMKKSKNTNADELKKHTDQYNLYIKYIKE